MVLGIVIELVDVTLDAKASEPPTRPGIIRSLILGRLLVLILILVLAMLPVRPLVGRRQGCGRRRRRRGRRDEAHAIRVGRLLVVVHQDALTGDDPVSRLGHRHRTRATAARRRHGLAIVVGWHVNGQHRQLTETKYGKTNTVSFGRNRPIPLHYSVTDEII